MAARSSWGQRGAIAALAVSTSVAMACGGSAPQQKLPTPSSAADDASSAPSDMSASAEIGALDERAAEQSFRDSLDGLQTCVTRAVERFAFLGGSIEFAVKVDASQRAAQVWAAESSLGERETEKCMFDALRSVAWPAPVGGRYAIARNAFEFDVRKGVTPPAVWDAGRVSRVLEGVDRRLNDCRSEDPSPLLVTLYVGDDGQALAAGAASNEPVSDGTVDCVVDTLLAARYPVPERAPTKVRFRL